MSCNTESPIDIIRDEMTLFKEHSDLKNIKVSEEGKKYCFFAPENADKIVHFKSSTQKWGVESQKMSRLDQVRREHLQYKNLITGETFDTFDEARFPINYKVFPLNGYYVSEAHLKEVERMEEEEEQRQLERSGIPISTYTGPFGSTFASTYEDPTFNAKMQRFQLFRPVHNPLRGPTEEFNTGIASYYGKK